MQKMQSIKIALANLFVSTKRDDELGSGIRNLYKYTKIYAGGAPVLFEDDIFRLKFLLKNLLKQKMPIKLTKVPITADKPLIKRR